MSRLKYVKEVQDELSGIAAALRAADGDAAGQIDAINTGCYTTSTEYLVEALGLMQQLQRRAAVRQAGLESRLRALERSTRELADLR